ncbi:hypothetical protein ACOMHN_040647 [Nucella lapillus]
MTSVNPSLDDDKLPPTDALTEVEAFDGPIYSSSMVRLVLNGRVFEVTEDTCKKIPLLKGILFSHEGDAKLDNVIEKNDVTAKDPTFCLIKGLSDMKTANDSMYPKKDIPQYPDSQKQDLSPELNANLQAGAAAAAAAITAETTLRFPRNASVFEAILDYVQTGEFHMPGHVCPQLFARDLRFWGLDFDDLAPCCYPKLVSFLEEQKTVRRFHEGLALSAAAAVGVEGCEERGGGGGGGRPRSGCRLMRHSAWLLVTEPGTSVLAKVYFVILCLMILTSFFVMAASTTKTFTRTLTRSEWKEYLKDDFSTYYDSISSFYDDDSGYDTSTAPSSTTASKIKHTPRALLAWVQYVSYACTSFLTFDYLFRLLACPSFCRFFLDFINLADSIALAATFAKYIIDITNPEEMYKDSTTDVINVLQLLRVLRFLRPMSKVTGFRVIYFTLRSCVMELLLLLALLAFLVMFFSSLLFYLGDKTAISSIPVGMWYALVTITTVGYGDVVPHSFGTKLIGCACTITGVLFLAMTLPIVVNNFFSLYTHCSNVPPSLKQSKNKAKASVREKGHLGKGGR